MVTLSDHVGANLNIGLIRGGKKSELLSHLEELRRSHSDIAICLELFQAVDSEYVNSDVFGTFLSWSKSSEAIALCIHEGPTRFTRQCGIKHFGKALSDSERWQSAWSAMGGTKGLVDTFARISVEEVEALATAIGACNVGKEKVKSRDAAIDELVCALLPAYYPKSKIQSIEKRPIQFYYALMVPACSSEFIEQLLDSAEQSNPLYSRLPARRLVTTRVSLLRNRVFDSVFGAGNEKVHLHQWLEAYLYRQPSLPTADPRVSESMAFSAKVLQARLRTIDKNERWPDTISEADIFFSLLHRSIKKHVSEAKIRDIIMIGLRILEAKPTLKPTFQAREIWAKLISYWKKEPSVYEDLLTYALRLELGGDRNQIGKYFYTAINTVTIKHELRWPLLRLYCLHIPKVELDIDLAKDFKPLAKQPWPNGLFSKLQKEDAIRLLQGLYNANPHYNFMNETARNSILSNHDMVSQRNFNVVLLLTMFQQDSESVRLKAEIAVDELRKKASTSREQTERAEYAKAASLYAIASGNLTLYSETVRWLQRYVRDPLTLKVVFGRSCVTNQEVIELLSGVPEPLPKKMTLAEVAARVKGANEILLSFHEAMSLAKREPSFHQPDWDDVGSLFGATIQKRVERVSKLKDCFTGPGLNVHHEIWVETFHMLEEVGPEFLRHAHGPFQSLFSQLTPVALAETTEYMLKAGNAKRAQQNRQPGDDTLERLSYAALVQLAKGGKPELAQQLILETILDRPDASSWHRQLLSKSFMKILPAQHANKMLLAFATAVGEKLEDQSYVKVATTDQPQDAPSPSLVRVTTVKYLAQLLDNARFISADAAIDVLVELLKPGIHIDILHAALESLLSLLNNLCNVNDETWKTNPLVEKVMVALETLIPIVGNANERRPVRQKDWDEAMISGKLPEITHSALGLPPLLGALVTAPDEERYPGLKRLQPEFVSRLFLPILKLSQEEHQKWIIIFMAKHKLDKSLKDEIVTTPVSVAYWRTLVGCYPSLIPQVVLEDFNKHALLTIRPPSALIKFNASILKDPELRATSEVKHWISIFGQRMTTYHPSDTSILVSLLHYDWPRSAAREGIAPHDLLEMVFNHASLFIDSYENYIGVWNSFTNDLRPPCKRTYPSSKKDSLRSMVKSWENNGRVVLERIIRSIETKREDSKRKKRHSLLPSTTKLRLWLVPFPCFPKSAELDSQCQTLAKGADRVLHGLLQRENNVLHWQRMVDEASSVSELLNTDEEKLRVASYIGILNSQGDPIKQTISALNLVRITLAMKLIEGGRGYMKSFEAKTVSENDKELVNRLRRLIETWKDSADEDIREKVSDWRRQQKGLLESLMR